MRFAPRGKGPGGRKPRNSLQEAIARALKKGLRTDLAGKVGEKRITDEQLRRFMREITGQTNRPLEESILQKKLAFIRAMNQQVLWGDILGHLNKWATREFFTAMSRKGVKTKGVERILIEGCKVAGEGVYKDFTTGLIGEKKLDDDIVWAFGETSKKLATRGVHIDSKTLAATFLPIIKRAHAEYKKALEKS